MRILITNDDGYSSPGIHALVDTFSGDHEVLMVAPEGERSAIGHGITLNEPLRIKPIPLTCSAKGYAVSGTPVDCVKLGLFNFFESAPDLIISGINPGSNTGINLNYSGTVGAAREAALNNILSIAVSIQLGDDMDFDGMARFVHGIVDQLVFNSLPTGTFLNINAPDIPIEKTRGVKITRQASNNLSKKFETRTDPKNKPYFWYGKANFPVGENDTDVHAISENFISITPVQCDATDYAVMSELMGMQFRQ